MPIDITTFIMLEKTTGNGWPGGRNITHIISLDEGHDRAYWRWVKHPKLSRFNASSVWIPEAPETALRDGLLMLIADGLEDESLRALIPYEAGWFGRVDLDSSEPVHEKVFAQIGHALENHRVHLMTFSDSCVGDQTVDGFENLTRGSFA
jgi:hypothetical protein